MVGAPGQQQFLDTTISFISPESPLVNCRYVSPGKEHNTAKFNSHTVRIFDARADSSEYQLDKYGFTLRQHESKVRYCGGRTIESIEQ